MSRAAWHAAAVVAFALAAFVTMRPWLHPRLLPGGDFPGFAAEVDWVRARLDRDGSLPDWTPERFGGATRFMSNLKDVLVYPLARRFGAVQGTKLAFLVARVVGAFGLYLVCARLLRSPAAGLLAGYAYGFGAPANLQSTLGGHLDLAISSALFPFIVLAAAALLRRGRRRDAVVLGALVAVEFCAHSYLQAMLVPGVVALLLVLRPWRGAGDLGLAGRWMRRTTLAVAVFVLLGASQAAWLAADLRHHGLHPPELIVEGLERWVEHTPLVYVNRGDWLGAWLREHSPPGLLLLPGDPMFNQRRYLGLVALAVAVVGWFAARPDSGLRRWFQFFTLLFAGQYWLAIGPRTLVWQMAQSFDWPTGADDAARWALTAGAIACFGAAVILRRRGAPGTRVELAVGLGLVQLLASQSLFGFLRAVLPVLRGMRSPGHFFDLAPLAFFGMFAVALTALLRRLPARGRLPFAAAVGVALFLDFRPTLDDFWRRRDLDTVDAMRAAVATLPGERGTLRIAASPDASPPGASLVTAAADAGSAWSWLYWQAGRHWLPYLRAAMEWTSPRTPPERRAEARRIGAALMASGRLQWVLEEMTGAPRLRMEPWTRLAENATFALFAGPPVLPMGTVFATYVLLAGAGASEQAAAIADAFARGVVTVAGGDTLAEAGADTVRAAGVVRHTRAAVANPASRRLAALHEDALLDVEAPDAAERWAAFLAKQPAGTARAAHYARPAPDRMEFRVDPGPAPAVLYVSEAHHPWWRARVDGAPAEVMRAQIAFMAVRLPAGARRVELTFEPPLAVRAADRVTQAAWVALATAALVAAALTLRAHLRPAAA